MLGSDVRAGGAGSGVVGVAGVAVVGVAVVGVAGVGVDALGLGPGSTSAFDGHPPSNNTSANLGLRIADMARCYRREPSSASGG
jgi:hypothetical protein